MIRLIIIATMSLLALTGCKEERVTIIPPGSTPTQQATVFTTKKVNGVWKLYKGDNEFYINGAATNNFYGDVKDWGGNVVRTYGTNESTKAILDEAWSKGLYVNLGLAMKDCEDFSYTNAANAATIAEQFENHRKWVRNYRNHPAVLCWSIGNEAEGGSAQVNKTYFKEVEKIAAMIHEEDPKHPTTITFSNSDADKKVKVLMENAPSIDILSINMYYPNVGSVAKNLASAGWDKPWMITEYGPRGTWALSTTTDPKTLSWGKLEEMTSTEKADIYEKIWRNDIKANESKGCIGSFIFLWGYQTHGDVLSWYGLFDKSHNTFGGVDKISECWTGVPVAKPAPRIENRSKMTLNGKTSNASVTLTAGSTDNVAKVEATSPTGETLKYRWFIIKDERLANGNAMPDGIAGLIPDPSKSEITFKAPSAGYYRLYVFVTDEVNHKVAMSCIPFQAK